MNTDLQNFTPDIFQTDDWWVGRGCMYMYSGMIWTELSIIGIIWNKASSFGRSYFVFFNTSRKEQRHWYEK